MGMAVLNTESLTISETLIYVEDRCRKCHELNSQCICWQFKMDKIQWTLYQIHKLDVYKFIIVKFVCIQVVNLVRKACHSLSGMRGLALLKKMDKYE